VHQQQQRPEADPQPQPPLHPLVSFPCRNDGAGQIFPFLQTRCGGLFAITPIFLSIFPMFFWLSLTRPFCCSLPTPPHWGTPILLLFYSLVFFPARRMVPDDWIFVQTFTSPLIALRSFSTSFSPSYLPRVPGLPFILL